VGVALRSRVVVNRILKMFDFVGIFIAFCFVYWNFYWVEIFVWEVWKGI
jgi:hypothetical protein